MHWIDIIIVIILAVAAFRGFRKGLIIEVAGLLALILGIYGGIYLSDTTAQFIQREFEIDTPYLPIISLGISILLIVLLVYLVGKLVEKFINVISLKGVNQIFGAFFGIAKASIILSLIIFFLNGYHLTANFLPDKIKTESKLYTPFYDFSAWLIPMVKKSTLFERMMEEADQTLDQL